MWRLAFIFQCVLLAQAQQTPQVARPVFTVSLPLNVNPQTVSMHAGFYGRGLSLSQVQTQPGVYDYPINVSNSGIGPPSSLKLLIHIPGYRMVTWEFSGVDIQTGRVFVPPLIPLPTAAMNGRLVDSGDKPLNGHTLNVAYFLIEAMDYFGYVDGSVPLLHISSVKTDSKGEFAVEVPSLLDDPFFQTSRRTTGQFYLSSDSSTTLRDLTLNPYSVPAQNSYQPLVIKKTQNGTLSGKLGKEFFQQNNLSEDLRVYIRPRDTIVTGIELRAGRNGNYLNATIKVDGSYEVEVPPGEYELLLWVPGMQEQIPVRRGLVVEENKRRVVDLP